MNLKVIVDFYKEQIYIFGICPCCKDIFHLPEASLSIKTKKVILSESKKIMDLQNRNSKIEDSIDELSDQIDSNKYNVSELKHEVKNNNTREIIKVKKAGRKQAIKSSMKFLPIFEQNKYDPRDARLIFSPIEFLIFNGLTEYKEISELVFMAKQPISKDHETIQKSISESIRKGNIDFKLIRYTNQGKLIYE